MADYEIPAFKIDEVFEKRVEELDGKLLFEVRLYVEGRVFEFQKLREAYCEKLGVDMEAAWKPASEEMGYTGIRDIRDWYLAFLMRLHGEERKRRDREGKARKRLEDTIAKKRKEFEDALAELPPAANPVDELKWVSSHVVMTRSWIVEAGAESVPLSLQDITESKLPCPSQRAVNILNNFKDRPEDFFKKHLDVIAKHEARPAEAETEEDAEIIADAEKTEKQIVDFIKIVKSEMDDE